MRFLPVFHALAFLMTATHCASPVAAQDKGLAPPTEPWAAQTSFREITLVWGAAPGATGYRLSSDDFRRSVGQARRYVMPIKVSDTLLQYYVESLDSKGRSSEKVAFNPVIPVTEEALPERPARPSSVSAAETSPGEITVTWSPVDGATAYFIGRSVAPKGQHTLCSLCSNATKYIDRDVQAGAEHAYYVAAITPAGTTQKAPSNQLTPSGEKGRVPIALRAVRSSPTSITLSWPAVTGALRYTIKGSRDDGAFLPVTTLSKTEYVYPVKPDRMAVYRFELISQGPKGEVAPPARSDPITVDPTADTPAGVGVVPPKGLIDLRAVLSSPTSITLTWSPVPGATQYTIKQSRDDGAFVPIATVRKTEYVNRISLKNTTVLRFEVLAEGPKGAAAEPVRSDPITVEAPGEPQPGALRPEPGTPQRGRPEDEE